MPNWTIWEREKTRFFDYPMMYEGIHLYTKKNIYVGKSISLTAFSICVTGITHKPIHVDTHLTCMVCRPRICVYLRPSQRLRARSGRGRITSVPQCQISQWSITFYSLKQMRKAQETHDIINLLYKQNPSVKSLQRRLNEVNISLEEKVYIWHSFLRPWRSFSDDIVLTFWLCLHLFLVAGLLIRFYFFFVMCECVPPRCQAKIKTHTRNADQRICSR